MLIKKSTAYIIFLISIISSCYLKKEELFIKDFDNIPKKIIKENEILKSKVLNNNIKTVLCHKKEKPLSEPIISINSNEKLSFSFDDLDGNLKNYFYTIIHCDSEWERSYLIESEYIYGFLEKEITDYKFSFNTIQKYTHYKFDFPDNYLKPILSGNYIFKIYEEGESEKPIILHRFMVLENKVNIESNVKRATLASDRITKHEIDFAINTLDLEIRNPYSEIKIKITQNNNDNNNIKDLRPIFVKNNQLIYDYEDVNTLNANNEFRYFDFKSLRYHSERIKNIKNDSTHNHVFLFLDKKRTFNQYSIIPDINGKFIIQNQEGWDSSTESDYAFVYFTLNSEKINYGDIFIIGDLSDWQLNNDFKMKYNYSKKAYEASIFLKQGYYNYMYALNDTITKQVDISFIEGTHYQTRNTYQIYVYYKKTSEKYDRLIGFTEAISSELF